MDLKELQKNWDLFGQKDPLWAILTHPEKKDGKWDHEAFFLTGELEIKRLLKSLKRMEINLNTEKALDFGCGIGRLSQALANHFDEVTGVDIAPSMIDLANKYKKNKSNCRFVLNERDDLRILPPDTYDLVYTNITLQHMAPKYAFNYLREFGRILAPGGILVFQLPAKKIKDPTSTIHNLGLRLDKFLGPSPIKWYRKIRACISSNKGEPIMEMYGTHPDQVKKALNRPDLEFLEIRENQNAGSKWLSYRYTVRKHKI
jgi:ubiquinone/menaquinone biosynthesis C-methylase UbiE